MRTWYFVRCRRWPGPDWLESMRGEGSELNPVGRVFDTLIGAATPADPFEFCRSTIGRRPNSHPVLDQTGVLAHNHQDRQKAVVPDCS